jgi:glycosyltransferase involved in cell wall biosynthesis
VDPLASYAFAVGALVSLVELVPLFVGRNHPKKGFDLLLGALRELGPDLQPSTMILDGDGTDMPLGAGPFACRMLALGERGDANRIVHAADAPVLPSRSEWTSNALLEAMATGIPALVTDVVDSARVVGTKGIVVAPASVRSFVDGLTRPITMADADRRRLGTDARERAATPFRLDESRRRYQSLWSENGS